MPNIGNRKSRDLEARLGLRVGTRPPRDEDGADNSFYAYPADNNKMALDMKVGGQWYSAGEMVRVTGRRGFGSSRGPFGAADLQRLENMIAAMEGKFGKYFPSDFWVSPSVLHFGQVEEGVEEEDCMPLSIEARNFNDYAVSLKIQVLDDDHSPINSVQSSVVYQQNFGTDSGDWYEFDCLVSHTSIDGTNNPPDDGEESSSTEWSFVQNHGAVQPGSPSAWADATSYWTYDIAPSFEVSRDGVTWVSHIPEDGTAIAMTIPPFSQAKGGRVFFVRVRPGIGEYPLTDDATQIIRLGFYAGDSMIDAYDVIAMFSTNRMSTMFVDPLEFSLGAVDTDLTADVDNGGEDAVPLLPHFDIRNEGIGISENASGTLKSYYADDSLIRLFDTTGDPPTDFQFDYIVKNYVTDTWSVTGTLPTGMVLGSPAKSGTTLSMTWVMPPGTGIRVYPICTPDGDGFTNLPPENILYVDTGCPAPYHRVTVSYTQAGDFSGNPGDKPAFAFERALTVPTTPSEPNSGSYTTTTPAGWDDGPSAPSGPTDETRLWMIQAVFAYGDTDATGPTVSDWTTPIDIENQSGVYVIWTRSAYNDYSDPPTTPPTAMSGTPAAPDWTDHDDWEDAASDDSIWMAISTYMNGSWSAWQISRVMGEDGATGGEGSDAYWMSLTLESGDDTIAWVQDQDGTWSPSTYGYSYIKATLYQGGVSQGWKMTRVTNNLDGTLATSDTTSGGTETITLTVTNNGSSMVLDFSHAGSGAVGRETFYVVLWGQDHAPIYYILPLAGTAIHNSTGTLELEARQIVAGVDTLAASPIELYTWNQVEGSYNHGNSWLTIGDDDINGDLIVYLANARVDTGGDVFDSITLVDIADGEDGEGVGAYLQWEYSDDGGLTWSSLSEIDFGIVRSHSGTDAQEYEEAIGASGAVFGTNGLVRLRNTGTEETGSFSFSIEHLTPTGSVFSEEYGYSSPLATRLPDYSYSNWDFRFTAPTWNTTNYPIGTTELSHTAILRIEGVAGSSLTLKGLSGRFYHFTTIHPNSSTEPSFSIDLGNVARGATSQIRLPVKNVGSLAVRLRLSLWGVGNYEIGKPALTISTSTGNSAAFDSWGPWLDLDANGGANDEGYFDILLAPDFDDPELPLAYWKDSGYGSILIDIDSQIGTEIDGNQLPSYWDQGPLGLLYGSIGGDVLWARPLIPFTDLGTMHYKRSGVGFIDMVNVTSEPHTFLPQISVEALAYTLLDEDGSSDAMTISSGGVYTVFYRAAAPYDRLKYLRYYGVELPGEKIESSIAVEFEAAEDHTVSILGNSGSLPATVTRNWHGLDITKISFTIPYKMDFGVVQEGNFADAWKHRKLVGIVNYTVNTKTVLIRPGGNDSSEASTSQRYPLSFFNVNQDDGGYTENSAPNHDWATYYGTENNASSWTSETSLFSTSVLAKSITYFWLVPYVTQGQGDGEYAMETRLLNTSEDPTEEIIFYPRLIATAATTDACTIISPRAEEVWTVGGQRQIVWDANTDDVAVKIVLIKSGTTSIIGGTGKTLNTGCFTWTVSRFGEAAGGSFTIQVRDGSDNELVSGQSTSASFTIED